MNRLRIVEKEKKLLEDQKKEAEDYNSTHVIEIKYLNPL
jgi:hypothetical protein